MKKTGFESAEKGQCLFQKSFESVEKVDSSCLKMKNKKTDSEKRIEKVCLLRFIIVQDEKTERQSDKLFIGSHLGFYFSIFHFF